MPLFNVALLIWVLFYTNCPTIVDESRNAQTVFRDKSGKRRDLDSERDEKKRKAEEKAVKDEKYSQWGKGLVCIIAGVIIATIHLTCDLSVSFSLSNSAHVYRLAQSQMHQQKLEDAMHEAQKPLARHLDDEDLDRMLREQERDGDPMAAMLRRKKDRSTKTKGFHCYRYFSFLNHS